MSEQKTLSVQKRENLGKGANHKLRTKDLVPGVFYDTKGTNIAVQVEELPVTKMFQAMGRTTVFNIEIDDNGTKTTHPCLFWDVQFHAYKKEFEHIDFFGVDLDKEIKIRVNIEFTGTSKGVKLGGKLETYREFIDVLSKPLDIPKKIVVDLTPIELGTIMHVRDLELPAGVRPATAENFAILSVLNPKGDEEK